MTSAADMPPLHPIACIELQAAEVSGGWRVGQRAEQGRIIRFECDCYRRPAALVEARIPGTRTGVEWRLVPVGELRP